MSDDPDFMAIHQVDVDHLDVIGKARADLQRANQTLALACVDALEAGHPLAAVARAADVTRQTIYRWRDQQRERVGEIARTTVPVASTLDEAARIMLAHSIGSAHDLGQVLLTKDVGAKARRVARARPTAQGALGALSETERAAVEAGRQVASRVEQLVREGVDVPRGLYID